MRNTRDEGVHFRATSSDNVIQRSFVHDTGTEQPQYGEGVYFGSAESNWDKYGDTPGQPDRSDRNQSLDNRLGPAAARQAVRRPAQRGLPGQHGGQRRGGLLRRGADRLTGCFAGGPGCGPGPPFASVEHRSGYRKGPVR
ncbi:hypothetical protein AB0L88_26505 [Saccharopolyspora shandongensis]|uniref:hypothetical protein n=1 Tax=Saccharopolyspora shandongensis TaxID=418495 RepID=UPI003437BACE